MRAIGIALSVLALAGCAEGSVRYAGMLTTTQGACGGAGMGAGGTAPATLIIRGGDAQFTPTDGVTVLRGQSRADGHVDAQSALPGADHKPFQQVFEGERDGTRITGRFASPRCRATVVLTRQ